jgi:hypothetical protein
MSPYWKYCFPGYLWSLPHTLVGLVLALVYRAHDFRWSSGCLECTAGTLPDGRTRIWGRPGAQTHGWLIIYASEKNRTHQTLRAHERVHVVQGFIGGPLFALAYVAFFLWFFAGQGFKDWHLAYMKNPFEIQAYDRQSQEGAWS